MLNNCDVLSIDFETDGLYGPVIAGAISFHNIKCPIEKIDSSIRLKNISLKDKWVIENILPIIENASVFASIGMRLMQDLQAELDRRLLL
jgi:hypothetical protein